MIKPTTLIFYLFCFSLASQNLVLNPSFEKFDDCPWNLGMFNNNVTFWSSPNHGSTDYFRACGNEKSTFKNYNGKQQPLTGNAYAGLYAFAKNDYREYVQGQLKASLIKGKRYKVSFYISLAEKSTISVNSINIIFTNERIGLASKRTSIFNTPNSDFEKFSNLSDKNIDLDNLNITHHKLSKESLNTFYNDRETWMHVSYVFKAKGEEQFFTIGNFNSNSETPYIKNTSNDTQAFAYYYIDDVSIIPIEETFEVNKIYTFKNVLFEFDKARLLDESKIELDTLFKYMQKHKEFNVEIYGHTDNIGADKRNNELSKDRAKSVSEYLISQGLNANRIKWFGFGSSKPISENTTKEGRSKNRRVEFKLIKNSFLQSK